MSKQCKYLAPTEKKRLWFDLAFEIPHSFVNGSSASDSQPPCQAFQVICDLPSLGCRARFRAAGFARICTGLVFILITFSATSSAQSLKIEEAQRAFQERYQLAFGAPAVVHWIPKPGDQTAPVFPEDGYYGDSLSDPVFTANLVAQLAGQLADGSFLGHFVSSENGSLEGLDAIPFYSTAPDSLPPITNISPTNYVDPFGEVTKYICKLKYIFAGRVQGVGPSGSGFSEYREGTAWTTVCEVTKQQAGPNWEADTWKPRNFSSRAVMQWSFSQNRFGGGFIQYGITLFSERAMFVFDSLPFTGVKRGFIRILHINGFECLAQFAPVSIDDLYHEIQSGQIIGDARPVFPADLDCEAGAYSGHWSIGEALVVVAPDFQNIIQDCEGCQTCSSCQAGEGQFGTGANSASASFKFGHNADGESAGELSISGAAPSDSLSKPSSLGVSLGEQSRLITDPAGSPRQVLAPNALCDIVTLSTFSYELRFYEASKVSAQPDSSGLYTTNGSPDTTWRVENPAASISDLSKLRITQLQDGSSRINEFTWSTTSTRTVSLVSGNGLRSQTESSSLDTSSNRVEIVSIRDASNSLTSREATTFHTFPWGESQTKKVIDPDGVALTTTWCYFTTLGANGYKQVQQMVQPTGYWERYEYDQSGRQIKMVAQYLDAVLGAAETTSRVTTTTYGSGDPAVTVVEMLLGKEVSRRYTVYRPGEICEIQTLTPGALWTDPNNLVTITKTYLGTQFEGELQSVKNPDGAMSFYTYSVSGNQKTTTVKTGQPNASSSEIVNGTSTVTVVDVGGNTISETSYDIASNLLLTSATSTQFDTFGRPTRIEYNDGTFTAASYGCCGIDSTTDREGITTTYVYDSLQRIISSTRAGITTLNAYDAEGRVLTTIRKGNDGSEITTNRSSYDLAGRLTSSTDALNHTTRFTETIDSSGHTVKTTTFPNALNDTDPGGTRIETFAKDGSLLSVSGTAVHPLKYEYGVDADGRFTKEIRVGNGGAETEWVKTYTDMAGRTFKTVAADGATSQSFFNNQGQLIKALDADRVTTLFSYNGKGEQEYSALDMNRNDAIDVNGTDRITRTQNQVATAHGTTVRQTTTTVWTTDGAGTTSTITVTETSADGLRSWNTGFGLTTQTQTAYDGKGGRTATIANPDGSSSVSQYQDGRLMSVTQKDSANVQIARTSFAYDAHGRLLTTTDARTGATTNTYDNADQLTSVMTPVPGPGLSTQTTSYSYDNLGRRSQATLPDKLIVKYEYNDTGELKKTFGARTYTSEYSYDSQGRLKTLLAGTGTTTWNYDPARGFLSSKSYADGKGPSYTYTPGGRLRERDWVRGIATKYEYNNAGELSSIKYSDTTPGVGYGYDRRGRRTSTSGGLETLGVSYNDAGQPLVETHTNGPLDGVTVTQGYDSLLRRASLQAARGSGLTNQTYTYDNASRLSTVSDGAHSVAYSYLNNSSLIGTLTFKRNASVVMTTAKEYDKLNRLTSIATSNAGQTLSSFAYTYNDANQRTRVDLADGSYWRYEYDLLGQVKSGKKYFADNSAVAGQQFEYGFDSIGNRQMAKSGGDDSGQNLRPSSYTANSLNQYTQRTVPGATDVTGTAASDATVTVNNEPVNRKGEYFSKELLLDNSFTALFAPVKTVGVKNDVGPNGEDAVTEVAGNVFVPRTPELYDYDDDGNLISDGRWIYTWDGENRLIEMESRPDVPAAAKKKLEFVYDYQGRRVLKRVYDWNGAAFNTQPSTTLKCVYDGWNMIAEIDGNNSLVSSYVWGLDLSGSMQRAGGVGGLLVMNSAKAGSHFYAFDGNGNVSALVNATDGKISAEDEYGPFGETIRATGSVGSLNPYRFSTKYADNETGISYYGYRYLSRTTGRWLSRDPIEETGGANSYAILANSVVNSIDVLGQESDPQEHHPISHNNNTWDHSSHPLCKCADMNLKTEQDLIVLEGHSGRHSQEYQAEVDHRMNKTWESLKGKSKGKAREALKRVVDGIMKDIGSGKLKPYVHKSVSVVRIIRRVGDASSAALRQSKGNVLSITMDVLSIIPGTVFEIQFIRGRMNEGQSFSGAVKSLWDYYQHRHEEQEFEQRWGIPPYA
jgi:RHS repeat-associated protein